MQHDPFCYFMKFGIQNFKIKWDLRQIPKWDVVSIVTFYYETKQINY